MALNLFVPDHGRIRQRNWGRVHLLRSFKVWQDDQEQGETLEEEMVGESIKKQKINKMMNTCSQDKLRENMAAKLKRVRLARFGGEDMLRSGKRSIW